MYASTKRLRPPTCRQMRAIECWLRNGRKSKARAILEAGYGKSIARQPHKVFDSLVVQRELELRGHGTRGVSNNEVPGVEVQKALQEPAPYYDLTKLTKEQLQRLKERLAEIYWIPDPFVKKEETVSLTSTTASIGTDPEQE